MKAFLHRWLRSSYRRCHTLAPCDQKMRTISLRCVQNETWKMFCQIFLSTRFLTLIPKRHMVCVWQTGSVECPRAGLPVFWPCAKRLIDRFHQIDTALRERGERDPSLSGMGTTLTVAMSFSDELFVANLGDSRAYLLRGSDFRQLTRDHTLAQAMI